MTSYMGMVWTLGTCGLPGSTAPTTSLAWLCVPAKTFKDFPQVSDVLAYFPSVESQILSHANIRLKMHGSTRRYVVQVEWAEMFLFELGKQPDKRTFYATLNDGRQLDEPIVARWNFNGERAVLSFRQ